MQLFSKHWFPLVIIILMVLLACVSYFRFMVLQDYTVSFEGDCDPYTQVCYVDCEDEECTSEYYFTIIERNAAEVHELCGTDDVLECEAAYECQPGVALCDIYFCDLETEAEFCEDLSPEDL